MLENMHKITEETAELKAEKSRMASREEKAYAEIKVLKDACKKLEDSIIQYENKT